MDVSELRGEQACGVGGVRFAHGAAVSAGDRDADLEAVDLDQEVRDGGRVRDVLNLSLGLEERGGLTSREHLEGEDLREDRRAARVRVIQDALCAGGEPGLVLSVVGIRAEVENVLEELRVGARQVHLLEDVTHAQERAEGVGGHVS